MPIAKYSLFLIFCFLQTTFFAQSDYYFEPITVNKGFMWFGTQRGLMRFDGYSCRLFGQTQVGSPGFLNKPIHALLEDKKGNLWVGTHAGDLCKRDVLTGNFQYLTNETTFKTLVGKRIQSLFEDQKGNIWIGTLDDGLFLFDSKTNIVKHYNHENSQLSNNAIFVFAQEKTGRMWVGIS
jgi:ligand-binding sensor domain-containing protein